MRQIPKVRSSAAGTLGAAAILLLNLVVHQPVAADLRPESRLIAQEAQAREAARQRQTGETGQAGQAGQGGVIESALPIFPDRRPAAVSPRIERIPPPNMDQTPVRDLRPENQSNFQTAPAAEMTQPGRPTPLAAPVRFQHERQARVQTPPVFARDHRTTEQPRRSPGWLPGETNRALLLEAEAGPDHSLFSALSFWQDPADPMSAVGEDAGATDSSGERDLENAEEIGERPQDNSLQFLRSNTVLLKPGQMQFDYGFIYTLSENEFPVAVTDAGGAVTGAVRGRVRPRLLTVPFQWRYGLNEHTQLFLDVPVGWSSTELSFPEFDEFSNIVGIGDMRIGASMLLKRARCEDEADLVGTFGMTFPTGNDSFPVLGLSPNAQLGEGYVAMSFNLLWIKTIDPLVLFYGGGYQHRFDDSFLGNQVDPGEQFTFQFGVGFGVNERITLSTAFLGAYVTEYQVNGDRIEGSILEPARLRFSATISQISRFHHWRGETCLPTILEPFAEIGMTNDAPSMRFGVVWTL